MRSADRTIARTIGADIDASPTPFHAVAHAAAILRAAGGRDITPETPWPTDPGLHLVHRDGTLVAWRIEPHHTAASGFRVVGAHTDSPNLRLKPRPDRATGAVRQLGVEVYGSALLNSWLDRDLGLAGRLVVRGEASPVEVLVRIDEPLLRVPQLAIHLDRDVNEKGLTLNRQHHLSPVWGLGEASSGGLVSLLAAAAAVEPDAVLGFDVMAHDLTPSTLAGLDEVFLHAPRIDDLLSCFLAVRALVDVAEAGPRIPLVCLVDHEEVGSVSAGGAASPLLGDTLDRIGTALGATSDDRRRSRADSTVLSADGAHATHPNYVDRHEPDHRVTLDGGPVLKSNVNQRYATDARSAAPFLLACEAADVPVQRFVNRTDLACGSTIGPVTAAQLGIPVVDAGVAQLSMHSAREMCGSADPGWFGAALTAFLAG